MIFEIIVGAAIGYGIRSLVTSFQIEDAKIEARNLEHDEVLARTAKQFVHTHDMVYSPYGRPQIITKVMPFDGEWINEEGFMVRTYDDRDTVVSLHNHCLPESYSVTGSAIISYPDSAIVRSFPDGSMSIEPIPSTQSE